MKRAKRVEVLRERRGSASRKKKFLKKEENDDEVKSPYQSQKDGSRQPLLKKAPEVLKNEKGRKPWSRGGRKKGGTSRSSKEEDFSLNKGRGRRGKKSRKGKEEKSIPERVGGRAGRWEKSSSPFYKKLHSSQRTQRRQKL